MDLFEPVASGHSIGPVSFVPEPRLYIGQVSSVYNQALAHISQFKTMVEQQAGRMQKDARPKVASPFGRLSLTRTILTGSNCPETPCFHSQGTGKGMVRQDGSARAGVQQR